MALRSLKVTAAGYTAELSRSGQVEIFDSEAHFVGKGRWDGRIVDCPSNLEDADYEALDEAIQDALDERPPNGTP